MPPPPPPPPPGPGAPNELVQLDDILAAREVIAGRVHRTPVMRSAYLGERAGVELYLKLEPFQKTGSFKPRGVLNKLHHLSAVEKEKGVISLSAGNHAQALAWGAAQSGIPATIVMPATAARSKIEATEGYGGVVVLTDGNLLETCLAIQEERGLTLVHPFDDPMIIAGQGTVGLEIVEDVPEVDTVVVGIGGGGLISGVATAIKSKKPDARVIGVEPDGSTAMARSVERGEPVHLEGHDTIADGLAAPFVGVHNLAHVQAYVDELVTVSDEQIVEAMGLLLERAKVVAEPAAAASVAALLTSKVSAAQGSTIVCVVSGGNIDRERLKTLL